MDLVEESGRALADQHGVRSGGLIAMLTARLRQLRLRVRRRGLQVDDGVALVYELPLQLGRCLIDGCLRVGLVDLTLCSRQEIDVVDHARGVIVLTQQNRFSSLHAAMHMANTVTTCDGQLHRAALAAIADAGEKLERFRAGESPHTRRIHYRRATRYGVAAANECDYDEYLDIPGGAVRARNGWQRILKRCAPARSGQEPLALIALITGAILIDSMHERADSYREDCSETARNISAWTRRPNTPCHCQGNEACWNKLHRVVTGMREAAGTIVSLNGSGQR
jgi:hypothetical protein